MALGFGFWAKRESERKRQKRVFIGLSLVLGFNSRLKMKAKHLVCAAKITSYFGIKNPGVFVDWKATMIGNLNY